MEGPTVREGPIRCIFFSEFHPSVGPKITFQVPDCIPKEAFDAISVYIIPKRAIQGRVVTVNALGYKIVGHPVAIDHTKYARNELMFNLCFVCDACSRTVQYEPIVRKLSEYLTMLESGIGFLSDEKKKAHLPSLMEKVITELNASGQCTIEVDQANIINLKVIPIRNDPPTVHDHDVPIFSRPSALTPAVRSTTYHLLDKWDLTTQQILARIDGFAHVAKIAAQADVDKNLVKNCIQHLAYEGVVKVISIFQYSNTYAVTPNIEKLYTDSALQEEAVLFVGKFPRRLPAIHDILRLYCAMEPGITIRDLCIRNNPHNLGIDERRLIQFGLLHDIIRRLQKHPVYVGEPGRPLVSNSLTRLSDGMHSLDAICCKTGLPTADMENRVERDPSFLVLYK